MAAVLEEEVPAVVEGLLCGGMNRAAAFHDEVFEALAVNVEHGVLYAHAGLVGGLNQHGGGAVTEEGTGLTVLVVDHRRHFLGAYHHHVFVHSGADVCGGVVEADDKACACGLDVIGEAVLEACAVSDDRCRGGETVVGVGGGADKQLYFIGVDAGVFDEALHGYDAHVR